MPGIDYKPYLHICNWAVHYPRIFKIFRHHKTYSNIVGGISFQDGLNCIPRIRERFGRNQVLLDRFSKGDKIGAPVTFYYEDLGMHFDPATLRYVRTLIDLMDTFGDLSSLNIVEIGCGYGGQCKVIFDYVRPKSYTLVDLPDALNLSQKYLKIFGVEAIYRKAEDTSLISYDLCISSYAYSEIDPEVQMFYNETILNQSKRGYIVCNGHISKEEMARMKEGGEVLPEVPPTDPMNFLYIWK